MAYRQVLIFDRSPPLAMDTQSPVDPSTSSASLPTTRGYQQEMLEESLTKNLIIALDTGSGKTHIAVLRMKIEAERESKKVKFGWCINAIYS